MKMIEEHACIYFTAASDELPMTELPVTIPSPVLASTTLIGVVLGTISVLIIGIALLMVFIIWYYRQLARKNM